MGNPFSNKSPSTRDFLIGKINERNGIATPSQPEVAPSTLTPSKPATSGGTPTDNRLNGNSGPLTIHRPTLLNAEDRAKQMKRKSLLGG